MFRFRREPQCPKIRGMLSEYIDNRLGSEDKSLVEHHLESCEACSKELESLRMTVQLLHRVPEVSVPRSFTIAVPEPRQEGVLGPRSLRWLRPATAVAAIVLVVLLAGDFLNVFGHEAGSGNRILLAPTGSSVFLTSPAGEGNLTDSGANVTVKAIPAPTSEGAGNISEGNITEGNVTEGNASMAGAGFTASGTQGATGPPSLPGKPSVSWPLRPIEIAMGVVVFALASLTIFSVRQRRKATSAGKVH
jgi:Putative zinc-finger